MWGFSVHLPAGFIIFEFFDVFEGPDAADDRADTKDVSWSALNPKTLNYSLCAHLREDRALHSQMQRSLALYPQRLSGHLFVQLFWFSFSGLGFRVEGVGESRCPRTP